MLQILTIAVAVESVSIVGLLLALAIVVCRMRAWAAAYRELEQELHDIGAELQQLADDGKQLAAEIERAKYGD